MKTYGQEVVQKTESVDWIMPLTKEVQVGSHIIPGFFTSITFCGCVVYHTENHIKRFYYNGSTWAPVLLYLDIISLCLSLGDYD
ncbi:transmembrane protein, putative [Medicago truncatula]|uniref:Transmembrane protein, putative n=1 Tax=Medicago truncatula TaxID=3880 RepID=G7LB03_MEDTR|nr:transmembrane protein, putative [Medicago truncatula]